MTTSDTVHSKYLLVCAFWSLTEILYRFFLFLFFFFVIYFCYKTTSNTSINSSKTYQNFQTVEIQKLPNKPQMKSKCAPRHIRRTTTDQEWGIQTLKKMRPLLFRPFATLFPLVFTDRTGLLASVFSRSPRLLLPRMDSATKTQVTEAFL